MTPRGGEESMDSRYLSKLQDLIWAIFRNTDNFEPSVPLSFPQVGFFPSECVELINEKLQQSVSAPVSKQGTTHLVFYLEITGSRNDIYSLFNKID